MEAAVRSAVVPGLSIPSALWSSSSSFHSICKPCSVLDPPSSRISPARLLTSAALSDPAFRTIRESGCLARTWRNVSTTDELTSPD